MLQTQVFTKVRKHVSRMGALVLFTLVLASESGWKDAPVWGDVFYCCGVVLIGVAVAGRVWCSLHITGFKALALITTGPYSTSRNPLYFFSLLGAVGVGLVTRTLLMPALIAVLFAAIYIPVIREEEAELTERHGTAYADYRKRVPVFLPSFRLLQEPAACQVNTRGFRKRLWDSIWFIWALVFLDIVGTLHGTGALPVLFRIR